MAVRNCSPARSSSSEQSCMLSVLMSAPASTSL
jgi:hypothetical protein